ncbi:MAG TPA: fructosamine kinase family protein [Tepidisphaeraceae bacterium]|nr:fructosamine kinase family protein [Tepidisphaeraceae bacterium]
MSQDNEISWPVLRRIVQGWAGSSAELAEVAPLAGGCISTTLALTLADGAKAVLKISAHRVDRSYQREAHQLDLLRSAGLPVPRVHTWKIGSLDDPFSYILMEFVDGVDWSHARRATSPQEFEALQLHLAELLRTLHETTTQVYCSAEPEPEHRNQSWPAFYHGVFESIWREVEKLPVLGPKDRKLINRVRDRLDRLIDHNDRPRLVHWDLWSSNLLARRDESGRWRVAALLDPNCKYAHFEAELAYLELFQTIGPAFMKAYQRDRKLTDEYHRVRKPVYQLHSLLNHVHLFGDQYARPLAAALQKVSPLV